MELRWCPRTPLPRLPAPCQWACRSRWRLCLKEWPNFTLPSRTNGFVATITTFIYIGFTTSINILTPSDITSGHFCSCKFHNNARTHKVIWDGHLQGVTGELNMAIPQLLQRSDHPRILRNDGFYNRGPGLLSMLLVPSNTCTIAWGKLRSKLW